MAKERDLAITGGLLASALETLKKFEKHRDSMIDKTLFDFMSRISDSR